MQLIKGNDVIGLKVISKNNGRNLDKVEDIVYDPHEQRVRALLLDSGGWFSDAKVILIDEINSIGKDAVIIDSENQIRKASDVTDRVANIAKDDKYLTKTKIITDSGNDLGSVTDIYFDADTGKVNEFEVSQGFKDMRSGKKRVKVDNIITVGVDATIVKEVVEESMRQQGQESGFQGMFNRTRDSIQQKTPGVIDTVKMKARDLADNAKQTSQQFQDGVQKKRNDPAMQHKVQNVKNKMGQVQQTMRTKASQAKESLQHNVKNAKQNLAKKARLNNKQLHTHETSMEPKAIYVREVDIEPSDMSLPKKRGRRRRKNTGKNL